MKDEVVQAGVVLGAWALQIATGTLESIDLIIGIFLKVLTAIITVIYIFINWPRFIAILRISKRRRRNVRKIIKKH